MPENREAGVRLTDQLLILEKSKGLLWENIMREGTCIRFQKWISLFLVMRWHPFFPYMVLVGPVMAQQWQSAP